LFVTDPQTSLIIIVQDAPVSLDEVVLSTNSDNSSNLVKVNLALRPVGNTQQVLEVISEFIIGQHAGGGKAEQISLRGFDMDHGTDMQ
jgi:hypothetical protein